jgi:hypothetical protein
MPDNLEFRQELEALINAKSLELESNTPDFILCEFLLDSLTAFDRAVNAREKWFGREKTVMKCTAITEI